MPQNYTQDPHTAVFVSVHRIPVRSTLTSSPADVAATAFWHSFATARKYSTPFSQPTLHAMAATAAFSSCDLCFASLRRASDLRTPLLLWRLRNAGRQSSSRLSISCLAAIFALERSRRCKPAKVSWPCSTRALYTAIIARNLFRPKLPFGRPAPGCAAHFGGGV